MFAQRPTVVVATINADRHGFLRDQNIFLQRVDNLVGQAFFFVVDALGRIGQDFDDKTRARFDVRIIAAFAGDDKVRTVKIIAGFYLDSRRVDKLEPAPQGCARQTGQIAPDQIVYLAAAGHGVDMSADVFVFDRAALFGGEIVRDGNDGFRMRHGQWVCM